MALVRGNNSSDTRTPGATSFSFSHTQDVGSDGYLYVAIATISGKTITSVTYDSVAMTKIEEETTSTGGKYWTVWRLASPSTGSNTLEITFPVANWNKVGTIVQSFTGCDGEGVSAYEDNGSSSANVDLALTADSRVLILGICTASNGAITQDAVSVTRTWNLDINNYHLGGVSDAVSGGTETSEVTTTATVAIIAVEILEAAAAVTRRIFIV